MQAQLPKRGEFELRQTLFLFVERVRNAAAKLQEFCLLCLPPRIIDLQEVVANDCPGLIDVRAQLIQQRIPPARFQPQS